MVPQWRLEADFRPSRRLRVGVIGKRSALPGFPAELSTCLVTEAASCLERTHLVSNGRSGQSRRFSPIVITSARRSGAIFSSVICASEAASVGASSPPKPGNYCSPALLSRSARLCSSKVAAARRRVVGSRRQPLAVGRMTGPRASSNRRKFRA